ncbi:MAG: hypothetical protein LJE69_00305 [Thiohalocapsa sp.]|jgi:hypothetical protein|uniref:hypothetical protein n=1 Tax=Thiohalocapsa sp. TaxID=2497641 RepID=UPI0025FB752E|nr:hypothetical protein [Thiohalocapsa sp.]MCG6939679.1 hypothetical protein [Thiohalocapsa sp.]
MIPSRFHVATIRPITTRTLTRRARTASGRLTASIALLAALAAPGPAGAAFLNITSLTPGDKTQGQLSGIIDGVAVTGSVVSGPMRSGFGAIGALYNNSTIDGASKQYGFASSYSPTQALGDQIGYSTYPSSAHTQIELTFAAPIVDLVFHIANLDGTTLDFAPQGLTQADLSIVASNGNLSFATGPVVQGGETQYFPRDADPIDAKSGYGSIALAGTFDSLIFDFGLSTGDGGSFQISGNAANATPVPETPALLALGITALEVVRSRWRGRRGPSL